MELSNTEKRVLLGHLRNPSANPKELADFMDMSYWTLMKTKKKLVEKGVMRFLWIPNLKKIGAEIIFSGFGTVKKGGDAPDVSSDLLFFSAMEDRKGFGIGISPDYSTLYGEFMRFSEKYGCMGAENFGLTMLPVRMADIWRIADFYPLISHDLEMEAPLIRKEKKSRDTTLKDLEMEVYAGIMEHPDWTGDMIARKLGTSRQRVLRLRDKFEDAGLLMKKAVVDLKKMGYELMVFVSWRMRPSVYRRMRDNINRYPLSPIIFGISTPMQGIAIAAFQNFRKSREIIERLSSWANPDENLIGEPDVMFLSVSDALFPRYFDFSGAIRRILKIK